MAWVGRARVPMVVVVVVVVVFDRPPVGRHASRSATTEGHALPLTNGKKRNSKIKGSRYRRRFCGDVLPHGLAQTLVHVVWAAHAGGTRGEAATTLLAGLRTRTHDRKRETKENPKRIQNSTQEKYCVFSRQTIVAAGDSRQPDNP
ncbi:hypothetical protein E2C01_058411 [Portunus trituberculatus]|uniref:Uncharacterized protein n=1 Tax=Portunus trituberculatus TaxID=210409 RepID=A0A5B7H2W9_PORTR|nr:hypothetical protein [Portunus trituberculatus]